jgi:protein-disulfide isomerase
MRAHRPLALYAQAALMLPAIGASIYMARHHETQLYGGSEYQKEELVGCAEAEGVSCDIVNTSAWSEVLGVPTFAWAVPTYLLVIVLSLLAARGAHKHKPLLVAIGVATVAFSALLFYISKVELGYVCLWCMRLYGVNAAILALSAASGVSKEDLPSGRELGTAAAAFAMFVAVTVGVQKTYRGQLLAGNPAAVAGIKTAAEVDAEESIDDPKGDPPTVSYQVTTEDNTQATVSTSPGDAWKGNPKAKVAIIEFADFECGYCKRTGFELRRLYEHYKDDVVFVFKHFPMNPQCNSGVQNMKHQDACNAAAAATCAQEQGKFWKMHDILFKNNHQLKAEHLRAYAAKIGLDTAKWEQCMSSGAGLTKVKASAEQGKALSIHGTPRIWINGELYRAGQSAEQMAAAIERALGRTGQEAQANAATMRESKRAVTAIPADVPEMRLVSHGDTKFYIDTFESSVLDGKAHSGKHEVPGIRMSWFAAKDACEAAGKRMCSEAEWITACQAAAPVDDDGDKAFADDLIEGTAYPYGDFHEPGSCWENHPNPGGPPTGQPPAWRPVFTGEMPGCVSPDGVYDLTGNVEEWVGTAPENAVLLGGAFDTPDDKARCYRRNDTFGAGYSNLRTGFRCCKNAN